MKKEKYDIDIIMGIYNCEKYLDDSIQSIINQTFKNWRLIMCDDGSTDKTKEIAKKYCNDYPDKIILLENEKNMGLNYTLNKCLENTSAKYIARQDGDDISNPNRLKEEFEFLENNKEYVLVSTNVKQFNQNGFWGILKYPEKPEKDDFLSISPICHAAVLIKRDAFIEVGGYTVDERLLRVEDYHLWFKLYARGYKGYSIQKELYYVRDDENAARRRTWKNRLNEYYVRKIGYKMLNVKWYKRIYALRPIILGVIPSSLANDLHKKKMQPINKEVN